MHRLQPGRPPADLAVVAADPVLGQRAVGVMDGFLNVQLDGSGDMAGGLVVIPIWIPQSSIAIGSSLLFIAMADQFVHVLRGNRPDYVVAVEERHARGDFSEDV